MYGIYANIGGILMVNVTIYSIHGSYGFIYMVKPYGNHYGCFILGPSEKYDFCQILGLFLNIVENKSHVPNLYNQLDIPCSAMSKLARIMTYSDGIKSHWAEIHQSN